MAFFLLALRVFGKKIILDFHGWLFSQIEMFYEKTFYNKLKVILYSYLERVVTRYSENIISASEGFRQSLGEEDKRKSIVLENGVDVEEATRAHHEAESEKERTYKKYSISRTKPLLGFLGNWERHLDMETMFKGVEKANVNMVVIGEGPKLNEFKSRWGNIRFTGKLPRFEALKTICLCDAVMMPYKESYGYKSYFSTRKLKDYLSLGKPIIMTEVRERETYLIPDKNTLLYKPENAEDLAEKIKILLSDNKLREKMRKNNLKLARRFGWQVLVEKSGLIEKLLEH